MKLDYHLRQAISNNIMNATDFDKDLKKYNDAIVKIMLPHYKKAIPASFSQKTNGLPNEWFRSITRIEVTKQDSTVETWNTSYDLLEPLKVPNDFKRPEVFSKALLSNKKLEAALLAYKEVASERGKAVHALWNLLNNHKTVASLVKEVPEFIKHIPMESLEETKGVKTLVALKKGGFDNTILKAPPKKPTVKRKVV